MASTAGFLDGARDTLGGGILNRISSWIGASPDKTRRGLEEAFPATMVGLAQNFQDEKSAGKLLDDFRSGSAPKLELDSLASTLSSPQQVEKVTSSGEGILGRLFGGKLGGIVDAIGGDSGLTRGATSKVMSLAAPLLMGMIGKKAISENMDAGGLAKFVGEQGRAASAMLPGSLSELVGGRARAYEERPAAARSAGATTLERETRPGRKILPWLIIGLLAIGALVWSLMRGRGRQRAAPPAPPRAEQVTPAVLGTEVEALLASGQDTARRFRVPGTFAPASADLPKAATTALAGVGKSLRTHPAARMRIEGYGGRGGDTLAQKRAARVKQYLVRAGVAPDRIEVAIARSTGAAGEAAGAAVGDQVDFVVMPR